jgi:hypothetical protein
LTVVTQQQRGCTLVFGRIIIKRLFKYSTIDNRHERGEGVEPKIVGHRTNLKLVPKHDTKL